MESDLKNSNLFEVLEIQQLAVLKELTKILSLLTDPSDRAKSDKAVNAEIAAKLHEINNDYCRMKFKDDLLKREKESLNIILNNCINVMFEQELEPSRKEISDLLAKEKACVGKLIKEQENEKRTISSYKIKVEWKKNEVYNKDNLTSLFSKHGDVITVVVLENKNCVALVEYKSKISAINAKNMEVGYPNDPLAVSFIGDYREDTKEIYSQNSSSETKDNFKIVDYATKLQKLLQAFKH